MCDLDAHFILQSTLQMLMIPTRWILMILIKSRKNLENNYISKTHSCSFYYYYVSNILIWNCPTFALVNRGSERTENIQAAMKASK